MTLNDASNHLGDIIPLIRESWQLAWHDIKTTYNNPGHDNRCRSVILQMQAVIHAREHLTVLPHVRYGQFKSRHLFFVGDTAVLQMKQLRQAEEDLVTSNFRTPSSDAFYRQDDIPGLVSVPRLTSGLVAKSDWTEIAGIYLTYPKAAGENNWILDITGEPRDIAFDQITFDEQQPSEKRFKPKRGLFGVDEAAAAEL